MLNLIDKKLTEESHCAGNSQNYKVLKTVKIDPVKIILCKK